jgi:hypothetical protein
MTPEGRAAAARSSKFIAAKRPVEFGFPEAASRQCVLPTLNCPSTRGDLYGSFQGTTAIRSLDSLADGWSPLPPSAIQNRLPNSAMSAPMECFRQSLQTSSVAVSEPTILSELGLHESEPGLTLCIT